MSGITVTCFAASYTLAVLLEFSRLFFESRLRSVLALLMGTAGLLAHTLYLGVRAVRAEASPLSSPHDWYLLAAWSLAALYLFFGLRTRTHSLAILLLVPALILIGVGYFASSTPFAAQRASQLWGNLHGSLLLLGTVTVIVGFVAGILYWVQSYRLKHKLLPWQRFRLPSLEWLERACTTALMASVLLIGGGFVSGVILNLIKHHRELNYVPWSDPVVLTLALMFLWLLVAALFNLLYRPARQGRKVAYLTVLSLVFLAFTLTALLLPSTQHGQSSRSDALETYGANMGGSLALPNGGGGLA